MMIWTIFALVALPLVVLRRRTLVAYYATDIATWLLALLLHLRFPEVDAYLGFVAVAVLKLATFSLFLARGTDVRWSANRAALVAAIVYTLTIPAMLRTPIDGDEPYYLLVTESIVHDGDLDLANQYRTIEHTASGRRDLGPQFGDPVGKHGEQYSRHEPFLPLLMAPGYAIAGLPGAIAVIALFGVLLVRSTVRWMEDEGVSDAAARAVFPFFAFGPPVLFYATRIWPEVPAAFFYVESLRGLRNQRVQRWLPAMVALVLLKLRFVLLAIGLVAMHVIPSVARNLGGRGAKTRPRSPSRPGPSLTLGMTIVAILAIPLLIAYLVTGNAFLAHNWRELVPAGNYARGIAGLLADGMSGIAFQAPFYLLGLFALTRWRSSPRGFRTGMLASLLYILYLAPRPEWFGGWAPPLRYIVFLTPVLALGAAAVWDRVSPGFVAIIAAWTIGLTIYGVARPFRLFHISNGENAIGEWLSRHYLADFSRLFPSFIRMNAAAWIGVAVVIALILLVIPKRKIDLAIPLFALALGIGFRTGLNPANHVEFEDAHVMHDSSKLYPKFYTLMRVAYRGGWVLEAPDSISFLANEGTWRLDYISGPGATIELAGRTYHAPATDRYASIQVVVPKSGRVQLRCVDGSINVDRMVHD
ncbi:MAG: hypothetical protein DMF56_18370 [Acidobacteria bacterium]|nr:MAG: hypothetical protein DMF56_18370 [Acidobacteriota bacterium]